MNTNTVWIDLGCPGREKEFARFFQDAGCRVLFFRLTVVGLGRIIETIAMHRLALAQMAKPHGRGGKDLLIISVQFPESLLLADSIADYVAVNSHREYYLSAHEHPSKLAHFFKPSACVALPADTPEEI